MKTFKNITFVLASALSGFTLHAQQDPMYTHYRYNTLMVNPGYAGSRDAITVTALHRSQWVDFKGAPIVQSLTLHSPLKNDHFGLGLAVMNDKIGSSNKTSVFADFAYRMTLTKKSKLALGISAGANIFQANLNSLQIGDQNDPAFQNNINNKITPNFGAGIYYSRERFYAGVSVPYLVQNNISKIDLSNGTTLIGKEQRHYFFIAGAVFNLSENVSFKPTTFVKVTAAAPIQGDVTASFIFMKKLLVGAMFRTGDAFGGLIGFNITEQLHLGYSFDWSYGLKTGKYNQGSHEVILRYDFLTFDKKQIHSPRHF